MDAEANFDRDAAQRILRRALRLSEPSADGGSWDGVSARALVEAADELGVEHGAVLRAMSEEQLGLLSTRRGSVDRLVGPATVVSSRVIDGRPDELIDRVDAWLRRACSLRRQRRGSGVAEYRRRSDVAAGVQRTIRAVAGEEDLRRVDRLRVAVQPVDDRRCVVALVADLRVERALALAGGGTVAGVGASLSAVAASSGPGWLWLGVPASAAAGVGVMAARAGGLGDVGTSLTGALDRVAAGDVPTGVLSGVGRRLLGSGLRAARSSPSSGAGASTSSARAPRGSTATTPGGASRARR